jgi:hypothetical protein
MNLESYQPQKGRQRTPTTEGTTTIVETPETKGDCQQQQDSSNSRDANSRGKPTALETPGIEEKYINSSWTLATTECQQQHESRNREVVSHRRDANKRKDANNRRNTNNGGNIRDANNSWIPATAERSIDSFHTNLYSFWS